MVSWADEAGGDGPGRINIRVPLQLLRAGVRPTSLIPPQALAKINTKLDESGAPIDLTELKPQHIEDLIEHLDDVIIDVTTPTPRCRCSANDTATGQRHG